MTEVKPTTQIAAHFFWAVTWRALLVGIPFYFVAGILGVFFGLAISKGNDETGNFYAGLFSNLVMIPITIGVIQWVLGSQFGLYRIAVVDDEPHALVEGSESGQQESDQSNPHS